MGGSFQYLNEIHKGFQAKIKDIRSEIFDTAVSLLREDIQNPKLNNPNSGPDIFMLRANQMGLALFENGFFAVAEQLYRILLQETLNYQENTGSHRHAGALYANIAGACAAQGNIDQTIVELLRAAQDDEITYGIEKQNSFAITDLLQEYFSKPVRNDVLLTVQKVNSSLTLADIEVLGSFLGDNNYAFLAYARLALIHERTNQEFPNVFSQLQILSALRNLTSLLEVELKAISGNIQTTLFPAIQSLFSNKCWWPAFENKLKIIGATQRSNRSFDDQLRYSPLSRPLHG